MSTVAISALPVASAITVNDVTVINQAGTTKQAAMSLITFASGTRLVFQQTSAPTGWTKDATHNDKALRIVSGSVSSGGATVFSSVFGAGKATGSTVLTTSHLPASGLSVPGLSIPNLTARYTDGLGAATALVALNNSTSTGGDVLVNGAIVSDTTGTGTTGNMGSGNGHTHTESLDLMYVDVIVAQKD